MKGKKLSVALVSTFIAALGLTACGSVTTDGTNIVTLKGYDGKEILNVDANAIYEEYKNTENGISSFYKAILEVLIRNYFEAPTQATKLEEFKSLARNKVQGVRETAASNAETNASDYAKELEKLLKDTYHVEDEKELEALFLYEYEKEEYEDKYFVDHLSELTSEYIGFKKDGENWVSATSDKHESSYPYHIRHILVKTSASKSDYVTGEITADEAKKLSTVYNDLASGRYTFGKVASKWSDDGSASSYGDAGIMSTSTSFVNEFKLGTYVFDRVHVSNDLTHFGMGTKYENSESDKTIGETLQDIGLAQVSYEVFNRLGECYDEEKSEAGLTVNDGVAKYYPRNIYWNHFLNKHQPMVIVDNGQALGDGVEAPAPEARPQELTTSGKVGFRTLNFNGTPLKVLSDEAGRPIYLTRSEYGIHFMVMQRTPFEYDGTIKGWDKANGYSYDNVSIDQYYTTKTPGAEGYPTEKIGDQTVDKVTYVNHLVDDKSSYNDRAETVKTAIKSFDPMYDYRMFEALVADETIKIVDTDVAKNIETYIANKRAYNTYKDAETVYDTWEDYLDVLNQQELTWDVTYKDTAAGADMHRYVNLSCARSFKTYDPKSGEWVKGGACYYAK